MEGMRDLDAETEGSLEGGIQGGECVKCCEKKKGGVR